MLPLNIYTRRIAFALKTQYHKEMSKIYVLVGMIASGKSTYSRNAARKGQLTLNDDAVVNLVHGGDYLLYEKNLKPLYKSIENHVLSLASCANKSIVIDRGLNISLQGRRRWLSLAKSFDIPCEAIYFPLYTPEVHAQRRFKSDNRGHDYEYWLTVASHHFNRIWEPTVNEGFDAVHHISYEDIVDGKVID